MTSNKRSFEYGDDDNLSLAIEHLNEAIEGYNGPYWKGRQDHAQVVERLTRARDEAVAARDDRSRLPVNQNNSKAELLAQIEQRRKDGRGDFGIGD